MTTAHNGGVVISCGLPAFFLPQSETTQVAKMWPQNSLEKSSWKYCNVELGFKSVKKMQDETHMEVSDL